MDITMGKKNKNKKPLAHFIPIYVMMLPGLIYLIINNILPMFGIIIAFKRLDFRKGFFLSDWAGLDNFKFLFASGNAARHSFRYLTGITSPENMTRTTFSGIRYSKPCSRTRSVRAETAQISVVTPRSAR